MDSIFRIIVGLGLIAGVAAAVLIWRARKPMKLPAPCCAAPEETEAQQQRFSWRSVLAWLTGMFRYLSTRREWRYETPWIMLAGENGAGKSSLIASASSEHRQTLPARHDELKVDGTEWQFFDQGVLIDPDGKLLASAGSSQSRDWERVLREMSALRPERALDGVLMAVSARTLLHASAEQRLAIAENAYRQLCDMQERFRFVLPVYVVVTGCDVVDGFDAFWNALPGERRREMFGWSVPSHLSGSTPAQWADDTFDTLSEQLKSQQLDAAAQTDNIADADRFFLFPRHFQELRVPLKHWLATVFQPSAWNAGFLCRGLYFTGSMPAGGELEEGVRDDVSFVDGLIASKVLAERNLARPTRQGLWSRNRLIRSIQIAGLAAFGSLALALCVAGFQLNRQMDTLLDSLKMLREIDGERPQGNACIGQEHIYPLLSQVAKINTNALYLAIPASWIDGRVSRRSAQTIADAAFNRVIMPGLACRLEARARELTAWQPQSAADDKRGADAYADSRQSLFNFLQEVHKLERSLAHFRMLSLHAAHSSETELLSAFTELTEYAYGTPLPKEVAQRGSVAKALTHVKHKEALQLPTQMQQRFARQIAPMTDRLVGEFNNEVGAGNRLLAQLNKGDEQLLLATRHFTRWLGWTRSSWLGSTADRNPCEEIRTQMGTLLSPLVHQYGYPASIKSAADRFNAEQCYFPSMRKLGNMQLPPYGPLFTSSSGALDLNPKLQPELTGLNRLATLDFMQVSSVQDFLCRGANSGWRITDVTMAGSYLHEYDDFARKQGLPALIGNGEERPLYDKLARRHLERVLNSTMRNAQAPDPSRQALHTISLQSTSQADQELARESASFSKSIEPLLNVLRMAGQDGFDASRARIIQCVRDYAADNLAHIDALVGTSRLYEPDNDSDRFLDTGTTPVTLDYLARQVSRSQVLIGYATPFLSFLQNTDAINEAQLPNAQTAPYWNNTIAELNRYVQFKEPAGQVAQLHSLFLKQFAGIDSSNCAKALSSYQPPAYGNDLFSHRREHLEQLADWRCNDSRKALVYEAWRDLADRFTRELANRYPFGELGARDARPDVVKAFFTDYATQSASLRQSLTGLNGPQWNKARRFLDQLDAVAAFFAANLTAGDQSQPVKLDIQFRAQAATSPGSNQIVSWNLTAGQRSTGYPNRPSTLDWPYGQPLALDMTWADRSQWRPAEDKLRHPDLEVDGASASFAAGGEWALLRLIERHRPKHGSAADALDPGRVLLEFTVPVVAAEPQPGKTATDTARLYLALNLAGKDPKTQAPRALPLPVFPHSAPQLKE